jgi:2'-5' RNA ligase
MSQKYVIVHFIDMPKVPSEFPYTEWPLHVTLLANFTISQPLEKLIKKLELYAQETEPFEIVSNGEDLFGPNQNVAVSLIQPSVSIQKIHTDLTAITKSLGAEYDEPQFMSEGFKPHATKQINSRLEDKQTLTLSNFTLVDMYPDNDINRRRIIKTYKLGSK